MKTTLEMVHEFHKAFNVSTQDRPGFPANFTPTTAMYLKHFADVLHRLAINAHTAAAELQQDTALIRVQLMTEELAEVVEAMAEGNINQVLHEGADLRYVVDGTMLAFGLGDVYERAVELIHEANMTKLGDDGKPVINEAGRIVKGPNFKKADVSKLTRI